MLAATVLSVYRVVGLPVMRRCQVWQASRTAEASLSKLAHRRAVASKDFEKYPKVLSE
jgi:hypothetical protein